MVSQSLPEREPKAGLATVKSIVSLVPAISIVIVSWNTRDLLASCLASVISELGGADEPRDLSKQTVGPEVIVVDNGSSDGSALMVRDRFPTVRLIENAHNPGFAAANNQAIRLSNGRYVLLLNPDTEVRPGAIEKLIRFMDENPLAGAAGPRLLNPDGTLQRSCYPAPGLAREIWRLFHLDRLRPYGEYDVRGWDQSRSRGVDVVQGACLIVRRAALEQVGLLDEQFFIYSEEVDLCERLRRSGWTIHWAPQADVVHYGGQSTNQVAAVMFLQLYRAKVQYFRKHHGKSAARAYKLILALAAAARLFLSPLARLAPPPKRDRLIALVDHYRQLLQALAEL